MDAVIANVTRDVSEDTLVAVLGDHGMTSDGNHGGASEEEVTAGTRLYVYL
jgi:phosphatidylinositol glycan class O